MKYNLNTLSGLKLLCAACIFAGILVPRPELDAQSAEEPGYTFQVIFLNDKNSRVNQFYIVQGIDLKFEDNEEVFLVAVRNNGISRHFSYDGSPVLQFFEEIPLADGEVERKTILSCDLGAEGDKVIVVAPRDSGRLAAQVIDANTDVFPLSTFRAINYSTDKVYAKIDNQTKVLDPRSHHDFSISGSAPRQTVLTTMAAYNDGVPYPLANNGIVSRKNERQILIVYPRSENDGILDYRAFRLRAARGVVQNRSDRPLALVDTRKLYEHSEE
ncbi:MAG: hypothetical protein ACPGN3_01960 [Opitutales bacterium]